MGTSYDIGEILDKLPELTQIFERDGHVARKIGTAWFVPCPFHEEKSPSCQVSNDRRKFHCYGCGASGDPFDYWQKSRGISFQDALADLASMAGVGPTRSLTTTKAPAPRSQPVVKPVLPLTGPAMDKWHQACAALLASPGEVHRIAEWRGIEPAAVEFAATRGLIGLYSYFSQPREAFLVEMPSDHGMLPVSVHVRLAAQTKGNDHPTKASWRYDPSGCGAWPWVVGDLATAEHLFIVEGQWDALALISVMGWHLRFPRTTAVVGLRGSTSGKKLLQHSINPEAYVFAIADADGAGAKWFEPDGLLNALSAVLKHPRRLHAFWPATPGFDLNDLVKKGDVTRDLILSLILPKLPNSHTRVSGPTFVQWCRLHKADPDPVGRAVGYVLSDPLKLSGRRPLRAWQAHWQRIETPPEILLLLNSTWTAYRESCS